MQTTDFQVLWLSVISNLSIYKGKRQSLVYFNLSHVQLHKIHTDELEKTIFSVFLYSLKAD